MGKTIASCCHEISDEWCDDPRSVCISKHYDKWGHPCISTSVECPDCRKWREEEGLLFASYDEADKWLHEQPIPEPLPWE